MRTGPDLVADDRRLGFVDHRRLFALDTWAAERGTRVTMVTERPAVVRLAAMDRPTNLAVQVQW